jgi:hypothetical protein
MSQNHSKSDCVYASLKDKWKMHALGVRKHKHYVAF